MVLDCKEEEEVNVLTRFVCTVATQVVKNRDLRRLCRCQKTEQTMQKDCFPNKRRLFCCEFFY